MSKKGGDINQGVQSQTPSIGEAPQVATQGGGSHAESMQQQAIHGQHADVAAVSAGGQGMNGGVGFTGDASTDAQRGASNDVRAASGMDLPPPQPLGVFDPDLSTLTRRSTGADISGVTVSYQPELEQQGKLGVAQAGKTIGLSSKIKGNYQKTLAHEAVHILQHPNSGVAKAKPSPGQAIPDVEQEAIEGAQTLLAGKTLKIFNSIGDDQHYEGEEEGELIERKEDDGYTEMGKAISLTGVSNTLEKTDKLKAVPGTLAAISIMKADANYDPQGEFILKRYLMGEGDVELNDESWSDYMMASEMLQKQIKDEISAEIEKILSEHEKEIDDNIPISVSFFKTIHAEVPNGEEMVGYNLLHGTNRDIGDFVISGTINANKENSSIAVTCDLNYSWNDKIDFNKKYRTDKRKNIYAEIATLGTAEPYKIVIILSLIHI